MKTIEHHRLRRSIRNNNNWSPKDPDLIDPLSISGEFKNTPEAIDLQMRNSSQNFRPDLGDIFTLNSPFNRVRPAPLPEKSLETLDFVKRRQNILGSLNDSKHEVKEAIKNRSFMSPLQVCDVSGNFRMSPKRVFLNS